MRLPIINLNIKNNMVSKRFDYSQKVKDIANDMIYNMGINSVDGFNHYYDQVMKSGLYDEDTMNNVGAYLNSLQNNSNPISNIASTVSNNSSIADTSRIMNDAGKLHNLATSYNNMINKGTPIDVAQGLIGADLVSMYGAGTPELADAAEYVKNNANYYAGLNSNNNMSRNLTQKDSGQTYNIPTTYYNNTNSSFANTESNAFINSSNTALMSAYDGLDESARNYIFSQSPEAAAAYKEYLATKTTTNNMPQTSTILTNTNLNNTVNNNVSTELSWQDKELIKAADNLDSQQKEFLFGNNPGLREKYNAYKTNQQSNSSTTTIINPKNNITSNNVSTELTLQDQELIKAADNLDSQQKEFLFGNNPGLKEKYNAYKASNQSNNGSNNTTNSEFIQNTNGTATTAVNSHTSTNYSNNNVSYSTTNNMPAMTTNSSQASNTGLMKLNADTISDLIRRINTSTQYLDDFIGKIETDDISRINNSWAANEARVYVEKVRLANAKIKRVNEGLLLLKDTYNKTLNESNTAQQDVSTTVNNL